MSRGIILYQSKYGATKKYVDWLVEELGYDYAETKNSKVANLLNYDVIILGGGVYASGIAGLQFLKKNIGQLTDKKIVVFAVGASPYDEKAIQQGRELHFKDTLSNIPLFYCRGAWDEAVHVSSQMTMWLSVFIAIPIEFMIIFSIVGASLV